MKRTVACTASLVAWDATCLATLQSGVMLNVSMKQATFGALAIISLFLAPAAGRLFAQPRPSPDSVICLTNQTLLQHGAELTPVTEPRELSASIKVLTNCTFQVNDGEERSLAAGQSLRSDGFLLNADGSIHPVSDHIEMLNGVATVFKDGKGERLASAFTLSDGSTINPDGTYSRANGRTGRLRDGQLLTLSGASLPGLDTITLRGGQVTVFKSGALLSLADASQIMGMYDGTKVRGDGFIISPDGTTTPLKDGQTITVEGVRGEW